MAREMLDRWAANHEERRTIQRFLDWCQEEHQVELCEWPAGANWPSAYPGGMQKLLDLYHEIDQQQLDKERRELLDEVRAQSTKS